MAVRVDGPGWEKKLGATATGTRPRDRSVDRGPVHTRCHACGHEETGSFEAMERHVDRAHRGGTIYCINPTEDP